MQHRNVALLKFFFDKRKIVQGVVAKLQTVINGPMDRPLLNQREYVVYPLRFFKDSV